MGHERALRRCSCGARGVIALRLTIGSGGVVRNAEIVHRTWSGPGTADAEACLLSVARGSQSVCPLLTLDLLVTKRATPVQRARNCAA